MKTAQQSAKFYRCFGAGIITPALTQQRQPDLKQVVTETAGPTPLAWMANHTMQPPTPSMPAVATNRTTCKARAVRCRSKTGGPAPADTQCSPRAFLELSER